MIDGFLRQVLLLIQPVGFVWISLAVLGVVLWRRRQRGPAVAAGLLFAAITVIGGTNFAEWLLRRLEQPWAGAKIAELPAGDAVLVLGGGLEPSHYDVGGLHFTKAGDRVVTGLEMMRLGKAPVLVIGGGSADVEGRVEVEADLARAALEARNLPAGGEVASLGFAFDTRDEALRFVALAKQRSWRRVLLVTSASHMRRAAAVYRAVGIEVVPVPCNFLSSLGREPSRRLWIPTWGGFEKFDVWMHETAGWAIYRLRGWVSSNGS